MNEPRPIEILGGGLAGLGLAIGLRTAGIPVKLHDAGRYPRHRVCGEFIAGLDAATRDALHLSTHLSPARLAHNVTWFYRGSACHAHRLPVPALCLSRHQLDQSLATAARTLGVNLQESSRPSPNHGEGRVLASGRVPDPRSPWVGLKVHVREVTLSADLELHLGRRAYVGLTPVEDGRVNVCGLFHRELLEGGQGSPLIGALRRAGLGALARRVAAAEAVPDSACSVAGLSYHQPARAPEHFRLGDHAGLIPPFTGHGMALAWQDAALALPFLADWSHRRIDWTEAARRHRTAARQRLLPRVRRARWLHPFLLLPAGQRGLLLLTRLGLLPTTRLYHLLH